MGKWSLLRKWSYPADSEVLPLAKWANLTSLVRSTNFTATQLHFRVSGNFTDRKRDNISAKNRFVISFCRYKGLGLAHLRLTSQTRCSRLTVLSKFSAKNITPWRAWAFFLWEIKPVVALLVVIYEDLDVLEQLYIVIWKVRKFSETKKESWIEL